MTRHARNTDPTTSHTAANTATPLTGVKAHILQLITQHPGITDTKLEQTYQLNAHAYDWPPASPSRLRTARHELHTQGHIEPTGNTTPSRYGRPCQEWRVVNR